MSDPPNILLLFTDQQRWDSIHALGNLHIRTPNLDRLVREGTSFTSAYTPSPVCLPARASMHFGRYPGRTRVYDNGQRMPHSLDNYVARLAEAGYRTHGVGKMHFPNDPDDWGYQSRDRQEEAYADPAEDDYLQWLDAEGFGGVIEPHGTRGEMYYVPQISRLPPSHHPTAWVADRSISFIEDAAGGGPWHLFSGFIHPHPPFSPPEPWNKLYRSPLMPLPNEPSDAEALWVWSNRFQNRIKYKDRGRDQHLLRTMIAYYYACVSFADYQIGRILDALEATGQLDRTLVLFTADHGELLGDYGCYGKRSFHDGSARIPMIVRWAGRMPEGETRTLPVSLVDVGPTFLAAAGAPAPDMDGDDLRALAHDELDRGPVLGQFSSGPTGLYYAVTQQWKYVWSAGDSREFLLDRISDPDETRNRSGLFELADTVGELRGRLVAELEAQGEHDALDGDGWKRYPTWQPFEDPDAFLITQDPPGFSLDLPGYT